MAVSRNLFSGGWPSSGVLIRLAYAVPRNSVAGSGIEVPPSPVWVILFNHSAGFMLSPGLGNMCSSVQLSTGFSTPLSRIFVVILARRLVVQNVGEIRSMHGPASQLRSHGTSGCAVGVLAQ